MNYYHRDLFKLVGARKCYVIIKNKHILFKLKKVPVIVESSDEFGNAGFKVWCPRKQESVDNWIVGIGKACFPQIVILKTPIGHQWKVGKNLENTGRDMGRKEGKNQQKTSN